MTQLTVHHMTDDGELSFETEPWKRLHLWMQRHAVNKQSIKQDQKSITGQDAD